MIVLSIPGTFRMILIILVVLLLIRFFNRLMVDKQMQKAKDEKKQFLKEKERSEKELGSVKIVDKHIDDAIDVSHEEVDPKE